MILGDSSDMDLNVLWFLLLGVLLARAGQMELAMAHFHKAVLARPANTRARANLQLAARKCGLNL